MYHHFCFHSIILLLLLNFYCYSTPISYIDQNDQDQISSNSVDEQSMIKPNKNDQLYYYNILCVLYNDCYNQKSQEDIILNDIKPKRLTSNLFHGIPKFGKRAFTSAFSGIPKFG